MQSCSADNSGGTQNASLAANIVLLERENRECALSRRTWETSQVHPQSVRGRCPIDALAVKKNVITTVGANKTERSLELTESINSAFDPLRVRVTQLRARLHKSVSVNSLVRSLLEAGLYNSPKVFG
jgi:hypothetical protein